MENVNGKITSLNNNRDLWNKLYDGFHNEICLNCRWYINEINHRRMSNPQPIPYIGQKFGKDKYRLMFVGIETYNNDPVTNWKHIKYDEFDPKHEQVANLFFESEPEENSYSHFWKWVKEISTKILGVDDDEAFKHIAYSNLHKCQSRKKSSDFKKFQRQPFEALSVNCIQRARWIYREIKELEPKNIIIFSGNDKQHFLAKLFLNDPEEKLIKKSKAKREDSNLLVYVNDGKRKFFVTRHPQGTENKIRDEIIRIITNKIKATPLIWKMP